MTALLLVLLPLQLLRAGVLDQQHQPPAIRRPRVLLDALHRLCDLLCLAAASVDAREEGFEQYTTISVSGLATCSFTWSRNETS